MVFAVTGIIHFQLSFNFACFRDELRMRRSASSNLFVRTVARRKVGMCLKQQSKGWVEKCLLACKAKNSGTQRKSTERNWKAYLKAE